MYDSFLNSYNWRILYKLQLEIAPILPMFSQGYVVLLPYYIFNGSIIQLKWFCNIHLYVL